MCSYSVSFRSLPFQMTAFPCHPNDPGAAKVSDIPSGFVQYEMWQCRRTRGQSLIRLLQHHDIGTHPIKHTQYSPGLPAQVEADAFLDVVAGKAQAGSGAHMPTRILLMSILLRGSARNDKSAMMDLLDLFTNCTSFVRMNAKKPMDGFGAAALIGFAAILAFNQVVIKVTGGGFGPMFQAGLRSLGAALFLLVWMRMRGYSLSRRPAPFPGGYCPG